MRMGRNPTKTTPEQAHEVEPVPPVTVALLTHVPYLAGFHAEQLDVVRLCVLSARANAGRPIYLVVVDNASCDEVVQWLDEALERGDIDQLIRNHRNLGKVTAMSQALMGSPGPDVVYADGDLRFEPGWLDAMLAVRDAFPDAAVIGGRPIPAGSRLVVPDPPPPGVVVHRGQRLDDDLIREHLVDTGITGAQMETRMEEFRALEHTALEHDGVTALMGASHCQFLLTAAARSRLEVITGREALSAAEDRAFDDAIDALGMLRLSTATANYRHVGNRLTDEDRQALADLGAQATSRAKSTRSSSIWTRRPVRKAALALHHATFRVLYEK